MIWLYRIVMPFALLGTAPHYLWRMARRGGYAEGFWHRFGLPPRIPPRRAGARRVWLQAVSVGEMLAIEPILKALESDGTEVVLSTTTSTGYRVAVERHRARVRAVAYFPIDWWPFSVRAWDAIAPDLAIITEGERWPEHIRQAHNRRVPVLCINGRISDRSFRRLERFPAAAAFVLDGITRILAGSEIDAARFQSLGYPAGRIRVTGNIKLDVSIPPSDDAARAALRRDLGLDRGGLILLGSSTWPGEEQALVDALRLARSAGIRCSLLVVPRHAERRAELERLLEASGLSFHMRSRGPAPAGVDVAVGDTTGELRFMTQIADVVFVGKSLPPRTEGQTPVEAAALGKPILMGPGMGNFREIAADLRTRGAATMVADAADLGRQAAQLLGDTARRSAAAAAAAGWFGANGGGVDRTLQAIREELGKFP